MADIALAVMDNGEANQRILRREDYQADFRRVEAASLKRRTSLRSAEGKRMLARCFYSFQASMYFVSQLGRTKLPHAMIEHIEDEVRAKLESAATELNQAIDGAEVLFKNNNIDSIATYDTVPLEIEVPITSALGRRYFELIHQLDQTMPLLQTLEIYEVITQRIAEQQRSRLKRITLAISTGARAFSDGVRRRMNDADVKKALLDQVRARRPALMPVAVALPSTDLTPDVERTDDQPASLVEKIDVVALAPDEPVAAHVAEDARPTGVVPDSRCDPEPAEVRTGSTVVRV